MLQFAGTLALSEVLLLVNVPPIVRNNEQKHHGMISFVIYV